MQPAPHNAAMWHTLRRLYEAPQSDETVVFNTCQFLNEPNSLPTPEQEFKALCQLRDQGVIGFNEENTTEELHAPELLITTRRVTIIDNAKLAAIYKACGSWQERQAQLAPIKMTYDGKGHGTISGRDFAIGQNNKLLFGLLYKHANEWVPQPAVFKTLRIDATGKEAALVFSTKVGNLRKALSLTTAQIKVSKKQVMLSAQIID